MIAQENICALEMDIQATISANCSWWEANLQPPTLSGSLGRASPGPWVTSHTFTPGAGTSPFGSHLTLIFCPHLKSWPLPSLPSGRLPALCWPALHPRFLDAPHTPSPSASWVTLTSHPPFLFPGSLCDPPIGHRHCNVCFGHPINPTRQADSCSPRAQRCRQKGSPGMSERQEDQK